MQFSQRWVHGSNRKTILSQSSQSRVHFRRLLFIEPKRRYEIELNTKCKTIIFLKVSAPDDNWTNDLNDEIDQQLASVENWLRTIHLQPARQPRMDKHQHRFALMRHWVENLCNKIVVEFNGSRRFNSCLIVLFLNSSSIIHSQRIQIDRAFSVMEYV